MFPNDRPDDNLRVLNAHPIRVLSNEFVEPQEYFFDDLADFENARYNLKIVGVADDSALEQYCRGKLDFHFHIWIVRSGNLYKYCVRLNFADSILRNSGGIKAADGVLRRICDGLAHGDEFVFVSRVQFLQEPQRMSLWIRSIVRLKLADFCESVRVNTLQSPIGVLKFV